MTPSTGVRLARYGVLAVFAIVGLWVVSTLRPRRDEPRPSSEETVTPATSEMRIDDLVSRSFVGDHQNYRLEALETVGNTHEGLTITFSYVSEGEPAEGTITAREGKTYPTRQEVEFKGDVVVSTAEGLELRTESLTYRGSRGLALSDDPITFRAQALTGSATGMAYNARTATVNLPKDVRLQIRTADEGEIRISSGRALLHQQKGKAVFQDDVEVTRGADVLTAERLVVFGTREQVEHIRATQDVHVRLAASETPAGIAAGAPTGMGGGVRTLSAHQLDVRFRPEDGSLSEVVGSYGAELILRPAPGDGGDVRYLSGKVLSFRWDELGRLYESQGQKGVELRSEPASGEAALVRTLRSRNYITAFDPESGEVSRSEFRGHVVLTRGLQTGTGAAALYEGDEQRFLLMGDPEIEDLEQGTRLVARLIEFDTSQGNIDAQGDVRHTLIPNQSETSGFLDDAVSPAVFQCERFEYVRSAGTATYQGEPAVLRRGEDEIRAPTIRLNEGNTGARRLEAEGGVVSLFQPEADADSEPDGALGKPGRGRVKGTSGQLIYDEASSTIEYVKHVILTQGEVQITAPRAVIELGSSGRRMETLSAGDTVEILYGERRATGDTATFRPAEGTMIIEGEKVVLVDAARQIEGRSLTFNVSDDTILVDGRDQGRTQTVFR